MLALWLAAGVLAGQAGGDTPAPSPVIYLGAGGPIDERKRKTPEAELVRAAEVAKSFAPNPAVAGALDKALRQRAADERAAALSRAMAQLSRAQKQVAAFAQLKEAIAAYERAVKEAEEEEEAIILAFMAS